MFVIFGAENDYDTNCTGKDAALLYAGASIGKSMLSPEEKIIGYPPSLLKLPPRAVGFLFCLFPISLNFKYL